MSPGSSRLAAVVDAESAASFYDGIATEAVLELRALTVPMPETETGPMGSGSRTEGVGRVRRRRRFASDTPAQTSRWFAPRWRTSGTASSTAFSTADTSESPSDGGASSSSLSSILEPTVPDRFYLSPRAALGILLRAGRRGRELPPHLRVALEAVVVEDPALAEDLARMKE